MPVYVFETIDVIGAGRGALIERIRASWSVHLEEEFGIRMVGVWATVGSTASWPEANVLWETNDWDAFGRAQAARFPIEEKDPYGMELGRHSLPLRSGGRHDLLIGAAFSPAREQVRARPRAGEVILRENVVARAGGLEAYHAAVASEYTPLAKARGLELVGAYAHALRPNRGMNLWAFRDWDHVRDHMSAEDGDGEVAAWRAREAELLVDVEGWLLAPPPSGALRT